MKTFLLYFLCIFSIASWAQDNVKYVSDNGFIVENKFETDVEAAKVWDALINDVDLWWPKSHSWWGEEGTFSIEPKAGGCFCENAKERSAEHMHIAFVDPNKLLRMTGGLGPLQGMGMHGALDWQFKELAKGTQVTLSYRVTGINKDGFKQLAKIVADVQKIQLNGLKRYVESNAE